MRDKILEMMDSVTRYASTALLCSTELLRNDPPELFGVDSVSLSGGTKQMFLDIHTSLESSWDLNIEKISDWLGQHSNETIESETSTRVIWRGCAPHVTLWLWKRSEKENLIISKINLEELGNGSL